MPYISPMKAPAEQQPISLTDFKVIENPKLDRIFKDRVLFPEKIEAAKEQIRQHGLPNELIVSKVSNRWMECLLVWRLIKDGSYIESNVHSIRPATPLFVKRTLAGYLFIHVPWTIPYPKWLSCRNGWSWSSRKESGWKWGCKWRRMGGTWCLQGSGRGTPKRQRTNGLFGGRCWRICNAMTRRGMAGYVPRMWRSIPYYALRQGCSCFILPASNTLRGPVLARECIYGKIH